MEKSNNVFVCAADFGWSDLGTWGSLHINSEKDEHQNAIAGDNVFLYDCSNSIVKASSGKVVVAQGLDGYIVVESEGALLICKQENEQHIKNYLNDVQIKLGDQII